METVVGPDGVRCQTTVSGPSAPVPADGGNLSVTVAAARDCTWTASSDVTWMQLNATSGQGNATLSVSVARNTVPAARSGAVIVNNQRLAVSQDARPCTYELRASQQNLSSDGGRGSISVDTLSGCAWTAVSSAEWLRVLTPSGNGAGTVEFETTPNTGSAREASITIGGQQVTISQMASGQPGGGGGGNTGCPMTLSPTVINAAASGGTHPISLITNPSCSWSASSSAPWATVAPTAGNSSSPLTVTVARNMGGARSATITVDAQTVAVNQAAGITCSVTINPTSANFGFSGGDGRVQVMTQDGCDWTMTGGANWTQVTNGRGTGSGEARYTVAATNDPSSRSTTFTIGGQTHTVTQTGATPTPTCTYSLSPGSQNFTSAGGNGTVTVTTQPGCAWTATSPPSWVSVNGGQGTGPTGQFTYTVQPNTGAQRSGTITVNGQTHTITQDAPQATCTYTLQPNSQNFVTGGGSGQFDVNTQQGCSWTASSGAPWVITSSIGTGSGKVNFTVQANSGAQRQTTITVAPGGPSFSITQDATAPTCTFTVSPGSLNFAASGGTGNFTVTTQAGCSWNVGGGAQWITNVTQSTASGPGSVSYTVQANPSGLQRQATLTVSGQPHTVTQAQ